MEHQYLRQLWLNWRIHLQVGTALAAAVAAAAWVSSFRRGVAPLPTVVTWWEWTVAAMTIVAAAFSAFARRTERSLRLQATLGGWQAGYRRRQVQPSDGDRKRLQAMSADLWVSLGVVFGIDLLLRLAAGLGWDPF